MKSKILIIHCRKLDRGKIKNSIVEHIPEIYSKKINIDTEEEIVRKESSYYKIRFNSSTIASREELPKLNASDYHTITHYDFIILHYSNFTRDKNIEIGENEFDKFYSYCKEKSIPIIFITDGHEGTIPQEMIRNDDIAICNILNKLNHLPIGITKWLERGDGNFIGSKLKEVEPYFNNGKYGDISVLISKVNHIIDSFIQIDRLLYPILVIKYRDLTNIDESVLQELDQLNHLISKYFSSSENTITNDRLFRSENSKEKDNYFWFDACTELNFTEEPFSDDNDNIIMIINKHLKNVMLLDQANLDILLNNSDSSIYILWCLIKSHFGTNDEKLISMNRLPENWRWNMANGESWFDSQIIKKDPIQIFELFLRFHEDLVFTRKKIKLYFD